MGLSRITKSSIKLPVVVVVIIRGRVAFSFLRFANIFVAGAETCPLRYVCLTGSGKNGGRRFRVDGKWRGKKKKLGMAVSILMNSEFWSASSKKKRKRRIKD